MNRRRDLEIEPWMLFALPAGIAVLIVAGILLGGPILGFLVAGLIAIAIVAVAIRMPPRGWRRTAARAEASAGVRRARRAPVDEGDAGWRRAAARRFLAPLALAVAGIVVAVTTGGTLSIVGWGLVAVAAVVAVSLVFLEIGYSEDRERRRGSAR